MNVRTVVAVLVGLVLLVVGIRFRNLVPDQRAQPTRAQVTPGAPASAPTPAGVEPQAEPVAEPVAPSRRATQPPSARKSPADTATLTTKSKTPPMGTEPPTAPPAVPARPEPAMPAVAQAAVAQAGMPQAAVPQAAVAQAGMPQAAPPQAAVAQAVYGSCFGRIDSSDVFVGVARGAGNFLVDWSLVQESATLFDGSRVEAANVPIVLTLRNGTVFRLAPHSRVTLSREHFALEAGAGEIVNASRCEVHARGLRIVPVQPASASRVQLIPDGTVTVTTVTGSFVVLNAEGPTANMARGTSLRFRPAPVQGNSMPFVRGCLRRMDEGFVLTDDMFKARVDVTPSLAGPAQGRPGLEKKALEEQVGKRIEVFGSANATNDPPAIVMRTVELERVDNCRSPLLWPVSAVGAVLASIGVTKINPGLRASAELPVSR